MAHIQKVQQKKTSTMSLTISSSSSASSTLGYSCSKSSSSSTSLTAQRHSSLVQPLCASPQRVQSPLCNQQYSGHGVAPSFVKCLHDVSTVKGQLVVLECRIRGTPLQVMWYREEEQILDSEDFRILRKKTSSGSAPEELCTLVITEAFPEDSGLFKCMALNSFGTVSCSAMLEVYDDEEQEQVEAIGQEESLSLRQEKDVVVQEENSIHSSPPQSPEDFPPSDSMINPSPEWPENPPEEDMAGFNFPDPQLDNHLFEGYFVGSEEIQTSLPSPPPSVEIPQKITQTSKLFTPSKLSFTSHSGSENMNLSDLPTFTPGAFPPSAFNYERPRHFIQSQAAFQAPSYESVMRDVNDNHSNSELSLNSNQETSSVTETSLSKMTSAQSHSVSSSMSQTQSQFQSLNLNQCQTQIQANGTSKSSQTSSSVSSPVSTPASSAVPPSFALPFTSASTAAAASTTSRSTMRSTITLTPSPSIPSVVGLGSASLPANQDTMSAPAAYLCSVLPSQSLFSAYNKSGPNLHNTSSTPTRTTLGPSSPLPPNRATSSPSSFPKPLPVSPSFPRSPISPPSPSYLPQPNISDSPNRVRPAVVSLPANLKESPSILPKPVLKKTVAPRPSSSRSTEEDIQGSKDALIQDLEKKLRSKEAKRRSGQKLSYEERMARRLLGPDNATYMYDQENLPDSLADQESAVGRHTGGLWGRHHSAVDERGNEGADIQEKCYAPRFLQVPADLTVEEGRFCRIDFKVGGLPAPDVCWYLDNKAIRPDDYHKMLVCEKGMHSFLIEIVTVHHAGVYECVAQNRAGEARFTMRLDVIAQEALRPPTFVQKMSNSRVLEGDTIRLECKVDASPPPQLFWKKDKDMLRIDPNRMSLYQDGSGRQCLLIERVTKSDAGWYTLSAINDAGMSTCNARLDISARAAPVMKTAPPGSKTLKLLSSMSHVPAATPESSARHTAPLYESEEL